MKDNKSNVKFVRGICVLIMLIMSFSTFGQVDLTFIKNWKSYQVPSSRDAEYNYNSVQTKWIVYVENNEVKVTNYLDNRKKQEAKLPFKIKQSNSKMINTSGPLFGIEDVFEVNDGYLVGFNRGEWGGELYWFSKNGRKRYEISGHQIVRFIKRDDKIYAIEGMMMLGGSIIEIKKKDNKWVAEEYIKLSTPEGIQLDSKENFIIITTGTTTIYLRDSTSTVENKGSDLLSIDKDVKVDTLVKKGMWGSLYPSSMVIQNDIVYVGMRKGVYKYDLVTKKDEWLLPE